MTPAFSASVQGPRPSRLPHGIRVRDHAPYTPAEVAADLSPAWMGIMRSLPDGDFPAFGLLLKPKARDSAIRRCFIERCGYHRDGQWQYRATDWGRKVREAATMLQKMDDIMDPDIVILTRNRLDRAKTKVWDLRAR